MAVVNDKSKCILCGSCIGVCPRSALTLSGQKINCDPSKCINCKICVEFCPMGALKLEGKND